YTGLKGKHAVTPMFGVKVPFNADDKVLPEKGTGLVMCCTFGDQTDVEWWQKHDLPLRIIVTKEGRIAPPTPVYDGTWPSVQDKARAEATCKQLEGLKIKEARVKTVELLREGEVLGAVKEIT